MLSSATDPQRKLFLITPEGKASLQFKSSQPHLLTLALDRTNHDLIARSSGHALLYRVDSLNRLRSSTILSTKKSNRRFRERRFPFRARQ
ncbi:hypothetical protein BCY86_02420 [Pajaroellobacter abortibovis]|uniref:Uncharacterized protein n=1 Tax=Pajaroellobacter abortibovis TaxID=1882918 RepID=A0A1L6MW56_9BACT|nr:hypothetical protein BCY86_02420 [Pajaroellobacter abortibovis]